jgi:hypothetical protein
MADLKPVRIELRLIELNQLFNSMDPSPFYEKDLDADAEDFIIGWADDLPHDPPIEIIVYTERDPGVPDCERVVQEAVQHFFAQKAVHERREFSRLMRRGRMSLFIGLAFLTLCILISRLFDASEPATFIVRESLIIVGWVAMWRPLEIFLYDWWPIRRQVRLFRRLSAARVRVNAKQK